MCEVKNNETLVICFITRETDAGPSTTRGFIGRVNAHVGDVVIGVDEAHRLSGTLINVVDITVCRIGVLSSSQQG